MPRDNRCSMYMARVCFYVCCSDWVGSVGMVCAAAVVKDSGYLSLGVLKYVVCLCWGDECCVFVCIVTCGAADARVWEV